VTDNARKAIGDLPGLKTRMPVAGSSSLPLVSAVIPTYNDGSWLGKAVASVLEQVYPEVECIVVDDGSTDETPQAVRPWERDPRFRYVRIAHRGVAAARNRGIQEAKGSLVAFLDADDWWETCKTRRQVMFLLARPDVDYCWCDQRLVDGEGNEIGIRRVTPNGGVRLPEQMLLGGWPVSPSCLVARRDALDDLGGFDETLASGHEDFEFFFRLACRSVGECVEEPLVNRRIRANSLSTNVNQKRRIAPQLFRKMMDSDSARFSPIRRDAMHYVHRFLTGHCWAQGAYRWVPWESVLALWWKPTYAFSREFWDNLLFAHLLRLFRRGVRGQSRGVPEGPMEHG
jgi:glycosyltransferase involved in cell wall biosynthesis